MLYNPLAGSYNCLLEFHLRFADGLPPRCVTNWTLAGVYNLRMASLGSEVFSFTLSLHPPSTEIPPLPVHTFEPCPGNSKSIGLIILGPHGLHPEYILRRRRIFLDVRSAQYFMVRGSIRPLICVHLSCSTLHLGIVIALFFQCMSALLHPANRTRAPRGIRQWWLVVHAAVMFSIVTIYNALNFAWLSTSYIDNREYPGNHFLASGPIGYHFYLELSPVGIILVLLFPLNQWLADGLLVSPALILATQVSNVDRSPALPLLYCLRRKLLGDCLPIPNVPRQHWYVPAFSTERQRHSRLNATYIAFGIMYICQFIGTPLTQATTINFGVLSNSISFALSILLTLMIVARLVLHSRHIRDAMGPGFRPGGLYKTIITIVVESYALFAVSNLLFLAPWAAGHRLVNVFFPIFVQIQVRSVLISP